MSTVFPIHEIQDSDSDEGGIGSSAYSHFVYILLGVILTLLVMSVVGVLVGTQKKKARGITWFPEGFLRNNSGQRRRSRRRGPDGQEMR